jgi:hypothetical protein
MALGSGTAGVVDNLVVLYSLLGIEHSTIRFQTI